MSAFLDMAFLRIMAWLFVDTFAGDTRAYTRDTNEIPDTLYTQQSRETEESSNDALPARQLI